MGARIDPEFCAGPAPEVPKNGWLKSTRCGAKRSRRRMPSDSSAPTAPVASPWLAAAPGARASARTRPRLRDLGAAPIPRAGVAGPSAAQVSPPPTQLCNSTGQRPPKAREERDGSRIARVLRVRAVSSRTTPTGRSGGSRPGPARPPCGARRRRSEIFREGGGTHGPHNDCDRAARRGGAGRGRLGILAVAPVTVTLAAERSAPGAARHRPVESECRAPWGARDTRPPPRGRVGARGGAGCVSGRTNL